MMRMVSNKPAHQQNGGGVTPHATPPPRVVSQVEAVSLTPANTGLQIYQLLHSVATSILVMRTCISMLSWMKCKLFSQVWLILGLWQISSQIWVLSY